MPKGEQYLIPPAHARHGLAGTVHIPLHKNVRKSLVKDDILVRVFHCILVFHTTSHKRKTIYL